MKEKIRNKKLKESSRKWLLRQLNDPFVLKAKKDGLRSRAAFKIEEIHEKYKVFSNDSVVVDLGAAPGGWSQFAAKIAKEVIAVDLLDMEPIPGVRFIKGDFLDESIAGMILNDSELVDVVMSDMAPSTCGIQKVDHLRIIGLVEEVFAFSRASLKDGGTMIAKVFQGGTESGLLLEMKKVFKKIYHFKPKSSRKESPEMYVVAMGFLRSV